MPFFQFFYHQNARVCRALRTWEGGGGVKGPPSDFGKYVNPILIRGQIMPPSFLLAPPPDFQTFLRPRLVCQGVCLLSPFQPCESPVVVVTKKPRLVHKWLWSSWSNFQASKKKSSHKLSAWLSTWLRQKLSHIFSCVQLIIVPNIVPHVFRNNVKNINQILTQILFQTLTQISFKNLPKIAFKTPRKLTRSTNPFSNDFQLSPERSHRFWMLK